MKSAYDAVLEKVKPGTELRTPDAASGKRTLPVRLGLQATAGTYLAIHLAALLAVTWLTYNGSLPLAAPLLPLILMVLAVKASGAVRVGAADRPAMTKAIEMTLGIHTLGSLWLTGCMIFRFFWPST